MVELTTLAEVTTANSCCAPEAQTTCCEPSAKAACCDPSHGDRCGCAAGNATDEAPAARQSSTSASAADRRTAFRQAHRPYREG